MRRRWQLLISLLLVLVGCGRADGPVEIPAEELPFSVSRTDDPIEPTTTTRTYAVYFVMNDELSEAKRELDSDTGFAAEVLRALIVGPNAAEREGGFSSQIPRAVRLLDYTVVAGTARVDLSGEFQEPAPPRQIALRVGQVVWTLTALPDVQAVSFSIDGEAVAVTTDDGANVERRVTREDYEELAPQG